jgi:DNA-binding response OmpR family regulator
VISAVSEIDLLQSGPPRDRRVTSWVHSYSLLDKTAAKERMQVTLQGKRILLIEDNADVQVFVSTIARLEGANLVVAPTGEDGLAAVQEESWIDLILLDLNLPGIQGWDVLEEINSKRDSNPPPVVVFSARTDAPTKERAIEMGAIGFIVKPVGARELVEQLKAFLSQ